MLHKEDTVAEEEVVKAEDKVEVETEAEEASTEVDKAANQCLDTSQLPDSLVIPLLEACKALKEVA